MEKPVKLGRFNCFEDNLPQYYTDIENIIVLLRKSQKSKQLMDILVKRLEFVNQRIIGNDFEVILEAAMELVTLLISANDTSAEFEAQLNKIIVMSVNLIDDACHRVLNRKKFDEKLMYKLVVTLRHINRKPVLFEEINIGEIFKFLSMATAKNQTINDLPKLNFIIENDEII